MNGQTAIEEKKDEMSAKEVFLLTAGGIILLTGSFFLVRHFVHKASEKRIEKKSSEENSPEAFAKSLKMAFENDGWPGTNMTEVRNTFLKMPAKDFLEKVKQKYQQRYHRPLMSDLSDELQSSEYSEILSIIAAKPDKRQASNSQPVYNFLAWAKRLKAAFDKSYGIFPGTDEDAIKVVFFEIPTQSAFVSVANAYNGEYHSNLMNDLKSELEFWEYSDYMKIITSKPKS